MLPRDIVVVVIIIIIVGYSENKNIMELKLFESEIKASVP